MSRGERNCATCEFYAPELTNRASQPGVGACHQGRPQVQLVLVPTPDGKQALTAQGFRPPVREGDWCGAWQRDHALTN